MSTLSDSPLSSPAMTNNNFYRAPKPPQRDLGGEDIYIYK